MSHERAVTHCKSAIRGTSAVSAAHDRRRVPKRGRRTPSPFRAGSPFAPNEREAATLPCGLAIPSVRDPATAVVAGASQTRATAHHGIPPVLPGRRSDACTLTEPVPRRSKARARLAALGLSARSGLRPSGCCRSSAQQGTKDGPPKSIPRQARPATHHGGDRLPRHRCGVRARGGAHPEGQGRAQNRGGPTHRSGEGRRPAPPTGDPRGGYESR